MFKMLSALRHAPLLTDDLQYKDISYDVIQHTQPMHACMYIYIYSYSYTSSYWFIFWKSAHLMCEAPEDSTVSDSNTQKAFLLFRREQKS